MSSVIKPSTNEGVVPKQTATSKQIRGSSLLLVGRLLSMTISNVVLILIVRYLPAADYGAFAYALTIVSLGEIIATFGLDLSITRFVPIYHEHGDYNKLFGTMLMAVSTIVSIGLLVMLFVYASQSWLYPGLIKDQRIVSLLLIMIVLSPVQALDDILIGLCAVFASPRSIFFRKYILAPGLKLSVVLLLILFKSDVFFLAGGYVAAGIVGVGIYTIILVRLLYVKGLFQHLNVRAIQIPVREILIVTIPLLTTNVVYILMNTMDAVLLAYYGSTTDVAAFRAVQPTAMLNQAVFNAFGLLFMPQAARLFARKDREGINDLYWQTAIWIAVVSFPIFALTFSVARPLTILLFTRRYEQSATILALLSLGYYFNAALGFNGSTLTVYRKVRFTIIVNILAAVVNLGVNFLLIPRYGALGAAYGTGGTLIAHNIFKQIGLRFGTGISLFDPRYFKVYLVIALSAIGLLLIQVYLAPTIIVSFLLAAAVSLLVLGLTRKSLNVGQTFPELLRLPLMRRVFS